MIHPARAIPDTTRATDAPTLHVRDLHGGGALGRGVDSLRAEGGADYLRPLTVSRRHQERRPA